MKKILFTFIIMAGLVACKTEDKKVKNSPLLTDEDKQAAVQDSSKFTSIQWLDSTYLDLGKVNQESMVEVAFRFKNTGTKPLVIADVSAGCGCTIPEKPEKPFAPGEEGVIRAKFNSNNQQPGEHKKYVNVTSNTNPTNTTLNFRVEVVKN